LVAHPKLVNGYITTASSSTPVQDILDGWDKALDDLYKYCTDLDVPITAHCTPGGAGAYGMHADPKFWETVLQKYPGLRLNLAHFGEDLVDKKTQSWAWKIGSLMNTYDHVYADTGAHETIYEAVTRKAYFVEMKKLFTTSPKAPKRYMYGTDWHMIIRHGRRYEGFYEEHSRHYDDWYADNNLDVKDFFFSNALDFLGLNVGDNNHNRLKQFYAANPKLIWSPAIPR
jgi:predicted TIM-barrel fold metal-dependent hydrolase